MRPTRRSVNLGLVASLAAPAFSRGARAEGDTIKIGMVLPVTGPAADSGKYALTGAKNSARSGQQVGRRPRKADRTCHRGRSDHQSGRGAGLLQARRATRHCRVPRLDPFDAESRHGGRHLEDRQACLLWRHRSSADQDGQSLAHSLSAQRFLFGPRDRRLRRRYARQEELGDRSFDRRVRDRRLQGAIGCARQERGEGRDRPGLSQPEPGFHAGRAGDQILRRRHHRLVFHLR